MPVLGVGGKLVLQREAPEPCILPAEQLNITNNTFAGVCPGYWTGDHIAVNCLPVNTPGVLPGDPDNWASYYGSRWFLGPNRDHISDSEDNFYKSLGTPGADYSGTLLNQVVDENITNPSNIFDGDNSTYGSAVNPANAIHLEPSSPGAIFTTSTGVSAKILPNHFLFVDGPAGSQESQADAGGMVSVAYVGDVWLIRIGDESMSDLNPDGTTEIRLYSVAVDGTTLVDGPPVAAECYPDGQCGDAAQFYARIGDTSGGDTIEGCSPGDYWIYIDPLGRLSFYDSRCKALAGCPADRLDLIASSEDVVIAPYGRLEYQNAVWECYAALQGSYEYSDVRDPTTLISICADAPRYQIPEANPNTEEFAYNNANVLPRGDQQQAPYWQCVADLREYSLSLSAPEVSTTAVAEKFGNAVKSLVNGGGSCEFFIDRRCFDDETTNGITLMQLLLMTEKGCKAAAKFYLMQRPGECGAELCSGLIAGDLYYEADILVTQTAVNVRPTELVVGTADFVTTGEIALREAY